MEYAGFWVRFAAYIIDAVILFVVGAIIWGFTDLSYAADRLVGWIIAVTYTVGFWTWRGQTPGKMALSVKIVRTDGRPVGPGKAILRYLGYYVSAIILLIGFFMIAFDSRKQGLHDKIAETYVVRV